jgi:hydrogenase maturation protease
MNEWEWRLLEDRAPVDRVASPGGTLTAGSRVRLRPRARGSDVMDILLTGRTAVVESVEQDYEGTVHLALVFDDDPGRDLGFLRQPGHRFFYSPEEVELLAESEAAARVTADDSEDSREVVVAKAEPASILIAGIGNIFLGDDGFGVEVLRRLASASLPSGVRAVDFGIRSLDLTYALMDAPDVTILVDACSRGEAPGTLFVIEPDDDHAEGPESAALDAHAMNPMAVIRTARSMGGPLKRILLVGCEPATLGPEEGQLGLSEQVESAVNEAVTLVLNLVREIREGGPIAGARQATAREGRLSE